MIKTIIQKNSYMDSVELMLLSKKICKFDGVAKATVMMGTAANIEIMKKGGFVSEELEKAKPNDMVISVDTEEKDVVDKVLEEVNRAFHGKKENKSVKTGIRTIKNWEEVKELGEEYNTALISVPGEYAAQEAEKALSLGKNVMLFSDNVTIEEERKLKESAHEKGLIVMGPDCGTSILSGVPLAFANTVRKGGIGIAGATGTGIQEISVAVDRLGGGISHAIGVGGRDLSSEINGISMKDAICALEEDEETEIIVVVSKPPHPEVKEEIKKLLEGITKPSVVLFIGEDKKARCGNIHYVSTTRQAAETAVRLSGIELKYDAADTAPEIAFPSKPKLLGLFSGGTLAYEAAHLIAGSMGIRKEAAHENGYILKDDACTIIDLGDDVYTRGKPHPMMDSNARKEKMLELIRDAEEPVVLLMDVVLGYGASENPALELAEGIRELKADEKVQSFEVIINLLGTGYDSQSLEQQKKILTDAGAYVYYGNECAVTAALKLCGYCPLLEDEETELPLGGAAGHEPVSDKVMALLKKAPRVINIGLYGFAKDLQAARAEVVHFEWKPIAGGDPVLIRALEFLDQYHFTEGEYSTIDEANQAVIDKIAAGQPFLQDVVPAHTVTDIFNEGKVLLHAGPPMSWEDMTNPMQGSCVGAALFEGWAETEEEAWEMLRQGKVRFVPCHHVGFVGPMGGITSAHMPVLKVLNLAGGNFAYCTMNEGIGQVLRFGAYGPDVVERLRFMRDVLGPVLSKALRSAENGLNVNVMVSRAIAMGDEFHQRNIAASLVFLKEISPYVVALKDISDDDKYRVIKFLADTDQFFLNIMMASAKSVMDDAATVKCGTVVTAMSRNGKDFGIYVSGMGREWYTGPVNTPKGLYFTGFSEDMANPDMGDSAITETFGVGGMAMIAAPAVTRFVGTGGFYDALEISNRMCEITLSHNGMFSIPTWDFQGTCLGIDIRKVVATGITPVINTGIAHKIAGQGQIGAGTVNPPLECFTKALLAYAKSLGFKETN